MSYVENFEWMFELETLTDELEDQLMDELDGACTTESGVHRVVLVVGGSSAQEAGMSSLTALRASGARVVRAIEDLVTRGEIARRADVTAQSVGNWLRGDRQASVVPPVPYVTAGVELWLWSEVKQWLAGLGISVDAGVNYPARTDYLAINAAIYFSHKWSQISLPTRVMANVTNVMAPAQHLVAHPADNTAVHFGLAA